MSIFKEIKILMHGGKRYNYSAVYVDGKLDFEGVDYDSNFQNTLLGLLKDIGNGDTLANVSVETVPDETAKAMGLVTTYPETLDAYYSKEWLAK